MCHSPLYNWNAAGQLVQRHRPVMAVHEAPAPLVAPWMDPKGVEEFLRTPLFSPAVAEVPCRKPCPWMKEEDVEAFLRHRLFT